MIVRTGHGPSHILAIESWNFVVEYPHRVSSDTFKALYEWFASNIGEEKRHTSYEIWRIRAGFGCEQDAVLFVLAWTGRL